MDCTRDTTVALNARMRADSTRSSAARLAAADSGGEADAADEDEAVEACVGRAGAVGPVTLRENADRSMPAAACDDESTLMLGDGDADECECNN